MFENTLVNRVAWKVACGVVLLVCAAIGGLRAARSEPTLRTAENQALELPQGWRPLALSDVEQRFTRQFPGTLARMTDGRQVMVMRAVHRPTRMLHPAIDCYRALGYRIAAQRLQLDDEKKLWRCFEAERGATHLRVCERIVDAAGAGFTDTSAWYWSAVLGQSTGPWQAITVASPL
ncbi:MAG: hypothetical protein HY854_20925 [Burkholderiales bacterium]|nr:hypothetical protein [Burkholderiales bacterium]